MTRHETAGGEQSPVVTAIHIAPASRLPVRAVESVQVEAGRGIVGDRYHGTKHRHVTVQSQTALDAAADELGSPVEPGGTRRNITISHGDVPTTPGERLRIGDVDLEVVRVAAPCKLLDDVIGAGARTAPQAGIPYLDVAAEIESVADRLANYDERARDAGIVVVAAMAFYGGLGDLLATAATPGWTSADEVTIAYGLMVPAPEDSCWPATPTDPSRRSVFPAHSAPWRSVSTTPARSPACTTTPTRPAQSHTARHPRRCSAARHCSLTPHPSSQPAPAWRCRSPAAWDHLEP